MPLLKWWLQQWSHFSWAVRGKARVSGRINANRCPVESGLAEQKPMRIRARLSAVPFETPWKTHFSAGARLAATGFSDTAGGRALIQSVHFRQLIYTNKFVTYAPDETLLR
jgi:hypothetical protein